MANAMTIPLLTAICNSQGSYLAVKIFRNTTSWIIKTWGVVPQQEKIESE
uniref:Uncharacterized protein n=1 Tax=Anguilla anguilla TaxID=7936 RepID=A0A0E9VC52_ANGAN